MKNDNASPLFNESEKFHLERKLEEKKERLDRINNNIQNHNDELEGLYIVRRDLKHEIEVLKEGING